MTRTATTIPLVITTGNGERLVIQHDPQLDRPAPTMRAVLTPETPIIEAPSVLALTADNDYESDLALLTEKLSDFQRFTKQHQTVSLLATALRSGIPVDVLQAEVNRCNGMFASNEERYIAEFFALLLMVRDMVTPDGEGDMQSPNEAWFSTAFIYLFEAQRLPSPGKGPLPLETDEQVLRNVALLRYMFSVEDSGRTYGLVGSDRDYQWIGMVADCTSMEDTMRIVAYYDERGIDPEGCTAMLNAIIPTPVQSGWL